MKKLAATLASIGIAVFAVTAAHGQSYPSKPIKFLVPFAAGGPADTMARLTAQTLQQGLNHTIVIDNRPGAGGIIGAELVMNAKPDGYTLFYGSSGPMGILPKLHKNLSYDPVKNFVPVAAIAVSPLVLLIPPGKPYKNLKEFAEFAKKSKDPLTFSSVGIGSTQHLGGELLSLALGIKMIHVPYKGSAPAVIDLLAGRIDVAFDNDTPNKGHIDAGKLIPIGVAAEKRLVSLPDVPTLGELGYPDVLMASWSSIAAPAGTPQPVVDKIAAVMVETMAEEGIQKFYNDAGSTILDKQIKDKARDFYVKEGEKFKLLIEKSGATPE
jgi:tripartite-type tricarboxylate transporter receptor subunit TctC